YTLLRLGRTNADTSALEKALRGLGAPLAVLDMPDEAARQVYGHDLLLLRPDLHVVWRGNQPPEDPGNVAATVAGYGESGRGGRPT
ncbi:MAG TPA: 2-polyprenyl-6-methoxyphenol hydroxylase, partial [Burkholderiales bacterium]|nr:2-polyprenyl-6-methoxyphenol hydroxylase [Burkholderiales bacterium]